MRRRSLPLARQVLELEAVGGQVHVELDARARDRRVRRRGAAHLHVLGVGTPAPAAGDVHVAVAVGGPAVGDAAVEDPHRLPLPVVLDDVADLVGLPVDAEDELPVEVVAVVRYRLDEPDGPLHERVVERHPREPLPPGLAEAVARDRSVEDPAVPARVRHELDLPLERIGRERMVLVLHGDELVGEVLGLGVEAVEAVVLRHLGAEDAVGAVGRRDGAYAAERRHVGPELIAVSRVLVTPAERRAAVQIGGLDQEIFVEAAELLRVRLAHRVALEHLGARVDRDGALGGLRLLVEPHEERLQAVVAVRPVGVLVVPHDLVRDLRILGVQLREGPAEAVLGRLAGGGLDHGPVLVELELARVRLGRLMEAVVEGVVAGLDLADRRGELALLVVGEDLGREEVLRLLPVALVEGAAGLQLRAGRRSPEEPDREHRSHESRPLHGLSMAPERMSSEPRGCQGGAVAPASSAATKVLMRAAFTPRSPCPSRDLERTSIRLVPSASGRTRMAMSSWKPKSRLVAIASMSPADGSRQVTVRPICRATASARANASGAPARTRAG